MRVISTCSLFANSGYEVTSHEVSQKLWPWTMTGRLVRTLIHACNDAAILFIVIVMAYYVSAALQDQLRSVLIPFSRKKNIICFQLSKTLLLRLVIH